MLFEIGSFQRETATIFSVGMIIPPNQMYFRVLQKNSVSEDSIRCNASAGLPRCLYIKSNSSSVLFEGTLKLDLDGEMLSFM